MYVWDGSTWVQVGDGSTIEKTQVSILTSPPEGAPTGGVWFDDETNGLYVYDGTYWVNVSGPQGPQGPQGVSGAQGPSGETGPQGETGESPDSSLFLQIASASSTYLTQSSASSTYLTQSSASSTYLNQLSASNIYSAQSSPVFTGTAIFDNVIINGIVDISEMIESVSDISIVSGSATLNYSNGNIFYVSSASSNFTVNLTNAPTTNQKTITATVVLTQGATGYIPNVFAIDNSIQTIKWAAGVTPTPTSSAGKIDIFNFTLIRRSNTWTVFGTSSLNF